MIGETVLEVRDLHTHFFLRRGVVKAVDGVSFSLRRGEVLGLVGESGCGKSLTALSLMRLLPKGGARTIKGEVLLDGENILERTPAEMREIRGRRISMVLQDPQTSLNPVFTVGEQLREAIFRRMRGRKAEVMREATEALRRVDIADAPPLAQAVAVLDTLLKNRILVAHAAWIEQAFLSRAFAAHGGALCCPVIDTAALARADGIAPRSSRRDPDLEWLAESIGLPPVSPHHALGDAITTAQVFLALTSRLGRLGYSKASDFVDLTKGDRVLAKL